MMFGIYGKNNNYIIMKPIFTMSQKCYKFWQLNWMISSESYMIRNRKSAINNKLRAINEIFFLTLPTKTPLVRCVFLDIS